MKNKVSKYVIESAEITATINSQDDVFGRYITQNYYAGMAKDL